ncbi:hypothetical protein [Hymenobacter cellulosilyticus]|uniref:hypothetical protein n=1 Tax=Hymenobacter cellulosilyticus TaxID=2932248 RepID=UPI00287FF679|nr:hypothetical protein [Hymenobacter cellulosilyticus]
MKKSHLFVIGIIAVAIVIIMSTVGDASVYVSFREARERAADGNLTKVHVVGRLPRDGQKNIMGLEYNPTLDPNYFAFTLVDTNRIAQRVIYFNPKPRTLTSRSRWSLPEPCATTCSWPTRFC